MPKDSLPRYYQDSKEKIQKKYRERYQNLPEEEKIKSKNRVVNDKKNLSEIEK